MTDKYIISKEQIEAIEYYADEKHKNVSSAILRSLKPVERLGSLEFAVMGKQLFGNPIPKEWYTGAHAIQDKLLGEGE